MIFNDIQAAAPAFRQHIDASRRILLLTHVNPDGDAIGSLLGAAHALRDYGKEPICVLSGPTPSYCLSLPGAEWLHVYQPGQALSGADLTWMLDTATIERVGLIAAEHRPELLARPLLITDHHVTNEGGGVVNLIDSTAASTADLLFRLLRTMDLPLSPAAATCLYLGLSSDTQSFQTSSTRPQSLRTAAELIEAGADLQAVVQDLYRSIPTSTMRLSALVLSELQREEGLVWATASREQMTAVGATDEALDDTVSQLQCIEHMRICALFKERLDGTVKLSLRSVPGINVARVAQVWGGGGHTQAAGATLLMDLQAAQATVLPLLRNALEA